MHTVRSNAETLRRYELLFHALGLLSVAGLFGFALVALAGANVATCAAHDSLNQERGLLLAAFTAGGLVAGRLVGAVRFHVREGLHARSRPVPQPSIVLDVAFILFLAVAAGLLAYETWALAPGSSTPPITSYVRCAAYHQLWLAAATAGSVGFMVSSWLWFPSK